MKAVPVLVASAMIAVCLFLAHTNPVFAEVIVRESTPVASPNSVVTNPSVSSRHSERVAEAAASTNIAYQIQQLQQEILALRGLLEEQGFELRRLKQQRLDDYLDLDKRLSALFSRLPDAAIDSAAAGTKFTGIATANAAADASASSVQLPVADPAAVGERELYSEAINQLLNQQDYQGAREKFNRYLVAYPDGRHAPNAYYWQGQILLIEDDKSAAETVFTILIDRFPDHQKVPEAKYKLATIYFDQGKKSAARSLLNEVAAGDSDASRLAKSFLSSRF